MAILRYVMWLLVLLFLCFELITKLYSFLPSYSFLLSLFPSSFFFFFFFFFFLQAVASCCQSWKMDYYGWYHSAITIGPEPKPTRNGATLHSYCLYYWRSSEYIQASCMLDRVYGVKLIKTSIYITAILLLNWRWYHCITLCLNHLSIKGIVL